jgi:uncharacterized protein YegP (UPF0339 family)
MFLKITIDTAAGGYRAHVWLSGDVLLFWSDIYASKRGARLAAEQLKSLASAAEIEDRVLEELR